MEKIYMEYKKDFDAWNNKKKDLEDQGKRPFFHQREIWWCMLGTNLGFEQDGTGDNFDRPVIVLKGFSAESLVVIPLAGKKKEDNPFHYYIGKSGKREATAILSQIRLIDAKRLVRKIGVLEQDKFEGLQEKLKDLLF